MDPPLVRALRAIVGDAGLVAQGATGAGELEKREVADLIAEQAAIASAAAGDRQADADLVEGEARREPGRLRAAGAA